MTNFSVCFSKISIYKRSEPKRKSHGTPRWACHGWPILLDVVYPAEEPVPSDATETMAVGIGTPPDEDRLAHDMVFRYEAPVA